MKHFLLYLFLLFSGYHYSLAQPVKLQVPESKILFFKNIIDSLSQFIQTGKAIITNSECLLPKHKLISVFQPYGRFPVQALKINGTKREKYIEMYAIIDVANDFSHKQDYRNFVLWMQTALDIAVKNRFEYEELHNWRVSLNNLFFHEGDYLNAMKISTDGLAKAEEIKDLERMAHYNNVLGYIMMKQENFELANKYFSTHLQLAKQIKNKEEEAKGLLNLADLSLSEKKIQEAINFINDALHIYQTYLPEHKAKYAYTVNKLAETYRLIQKNKEALRHALQAIELVKNEGGHNLYDIAAYYINAAYGYNEASQPDSALVYSNSGLTIALGIKHRELMRDAYEQLSFSFAIKEEFDSAYTYQQLFSKLKDSIVNENSQKEILQREANLQIERQKRIQEAAVSRQQLLRNIIIGVSVLAIVVLVMLYNRRQIKQKMRYQKELNKQQTELMNTVITVQDKERKRIAEDLHDSLGSILSAAKLKLSAVAGTANENGRSNYKDTMNLLDEAVNEMRNISHNLLPASLLRLGLIAGLQNLLDKITSRSDLHINFIAHGFKKRIDENIEVSIYRIVLEAVNNIVKHARAKNVTVQLMQYDTYINVLIEDDGVGFDKTIVSKKQGIGLNNIFSRVDYMKGRVDIDTRPKAGTVINIDIPYQQV